MIVNHQSQAVNMSGVESLAFAIEGSAMIYKLMYSTMFQDKEKVVLQELAANALDAHNAAGKKDVPIRITLPTELSPELVIEDEGIGMSYDTVCNVYPVYGRSLKSDNNSAIGGFGYGGKSPFSISDSYTVETTHQGITTSVACYLDNAFPKFSVFNSGNIGKPDGTVVRVPVSDTGKQQILKKKAEKLFVLWETKPTFVGEAIEYDTTPLYENENIIVYKANTVSKYQYSANKKIYQVAVGPYIYEIPDSMVDKLQSVPDYNQFCEVARSPFIYDVVFKFAIGELELSPSREWIENTPENLKRLEHVVKAQLAVIKTTVTPIGVDWYTRIADVIQTHGVWSQQVLPNCKYNVPLGVDAAYINTALKELRGTNTNPLTNNYDSATVWDAVIYEVKKTLTTDRSLGFTEAQAPRGTSDLLSPCFMYHDDERRCHQLYLRLPAVNEDTQSSILRSVLGINSTGVIRRKVNNDKISASRNNSYCTAGQMLSRQAFNPQSRIVLTTDKQHKHVNCYLRQTGDGVYTIVEVDSTTIGHIKAYLKANEQAIQKLNVKIAFPEDLESAYTAYSAELKLRRKTRTVAGTPAVKDPVIGIRYTNVSTSDNVPITKSELVNFKFDSAKRYVICRKPPSSRYANSTSLLNSHVKDRCLNTLPSIEVIVLSDSAKSKTAWWSNFEQTASQYANITFVESTEHNDFLEYFKQLPESLMFDAVLSNWEAYVALFSTNSSAAFRTLATLHSVSYDIACMNKYIPYYCHATDVTRKLEEELYANNTLKTVFAKIHTALTHNDSTFLDLITDDEKAEYLKTVTSYLNFNLSEDNS